MKISYRTHPVLEMLETAKPSVKFENGHPELRNIAVEFYRNWIENRATFKQEITVFSKAFVDAATGAYDKMVKSGLFDEVPTGRQSGTIVFGALSVCYDCERRRVGGVGETHVKIVAFSNGNCLDRMSTANMVYVSNDPNNPGNEHLQEPIDGIKGYWDFVLTLLLFKKYAPVETKYLPAGQKVKGIDCKYVNETNSNITFLDSKWFTTLVKSDGFKVRGHFRLQPKKKDGEWTKELIWIADFEKTGYTAPAKILNTNTHEKEPPQENEA